MTKKQTSVDFAKSFEELEKITQWFDSEEHLDLDKGLKQFERGLELASLLKEKLSEVENKVVEIKKKFET
ncbi:exodeoxyribonuclease VII small subunit [Candidatus Uhrbacteria bacterium RIFOXYB2_FULL_45_11]|uniref:Exodeoxyribonuclease VII small subunit n=1 Tax=Candidatus Uhrbacteria bacterium RIFOXYB2_FULL_45_11 TaxID=1802421 RepID=A0A1F7WC31_9BACT|nr:MAG: exodeoxyribonuclease VII small subunit [Candidatus Uhrbacteria bacterium RIFOXYB2_FULL_45_11]